MLLGSIGVDPRASAVPCLGFLVTETIYPALLGLKAASVPFPAYRYWLSR
jgi:hypothetical protein